MSSRQLQKLSAPRAAPLGEAGQAALEGVAVQVGQAGQADGVALISRLRRDAGADLRDQPATCPIRAPAGPIPGAAAPIQTTGPSWRTLLMIGRHGAAQGKCAPMNATPAWLNVQRGTAPLLLCMPHTGTSIPAGD